MAQYVFHNEVKGREKLYPPKKKNFDVNFFCLSFSGAKIGDLAQIESG